MRSGGQKEGSTGQPGGLRGIQGVSGPVKKVSRLASEVWGPAGEVWSIGQLEEVKGSENQLLAPVGDEVLENEV